MFRFLKRIQFRFKREIPYTPQSIDDFIIDILWAYGFEDTPQNRNIIHTALLRTDITVPTIAPYRLAVFLKRLKGNEVNFYINKKYDDDKKREAEIKNKEAELKSE